jgi:chaperonin GroEL (HSP60 family)
MKSTNPTSAMQDLLKKRHHCSRMTFVTGCKESKTTSILLRGGTEHVVTDLREPLKMLSEL